jgi:hypothetical protein
MQTCYITVVLYDHELTTEFELSKSSTPDPNSSSISVSVPWLAGYSLALTLTDELKSSS